MQPSLEQAVTGEPDDFRIAAAAVSDPARLAALDALAVLDTPAEEGFDDVVRLATRLCAAPVALVSFVAADRQWFKARIGFPACETDLDRSVCKFALAEPDLLVVEDLTADPRTAANPLVTAEPGIRFYAGAPLRLPGGQVLGSLCVIDTVPRPGGLTPEQAEDLRALGRQVVTLLVARKALSEGWASARREREEQASKVARAEVSEAQNLSLRASEARARAAQEAGGIGTYEIDVATGMIQASAEMCRIYGLPISPLYSASAFEALVLPEDAAIRSSDESRQDGSAPLDVEYRIRRASDGEVRWIARRARFIDGGGSSPQSMFGTVRDITERRAIQDALQAAEALARENAERLQLAMAAGAIVGTWNWDIPGDRFTVDEAFATAFGLDPALGRAGIPLARIVETVHPDDQAGLAVAIEAAIAHGGAYAYQYRVRRADGRYHWIEANGRVNKALDGAPMSFPGVLLDVEERRASQEALRESEEHYRSLFENIDAGFCTVEMAFDENGTAVDYRFLEINPAFVVQTGLVDAEGKWMRELAPAHEQHWFDIYGRVALTGVPVRFEHEAAALGRWYEVHAYRVGEPGARQVAILFNDISARRAAEERQDLLNHELSHRLKNTLTIVQSLASQTLRGVSERDVVETYERRLIALSRAHDVLLKGHYEAASIKAVVDTVLSTLEPQDRLAVEGEDVSLGPQAALSLSLLLHELGTNAAKYGAWSKGRGEVTVTWRVERCEEPTFVLDWRERGGPPAIEPTRRGFGSRLIKMGLLGTRGTVLRFMETGFEAEFRAPDAQVRSA